MSGWISVDDDLPKKPGWKLVRLKERPEIIETRSYLPDSYDGDRLLEKAHWMSWMGGHYGFEPATVTHWMEYPE